MSAIRYCWLTLHTASERVPCKARWTLALSLVVLHKTGCIGAAWVWGDTWIDTVAKIASLIPWALFVGLTTNRLRYDCWNWKRNWSFVCCKAMIWAFCTHWFSHSAHLLFLCNPVCRYRTWFWEEVCCELCTLHCWHKEIWPSRDLYIFPANRTACWDSLCLLYIQPLVLELLNRKKDGLK